ncbi:MAG: GNAT family N-acetyltransferase [Defluviitaleaceae bacterium]|nr:GNAT family N-acetyltransferase [Defluviitaleaceae bacterium]
MQIIEIIDISDKSDICNLVLWALPNWFGIEKSIVDYVDTVREMPFFAVFDDKMAIGFVALKIHNEYTAEIYVMGILEEYHKQGIGKKIVATCEEHCKENNIEFLTVKTLAELREDENYRKTRLFYQAMGFKPLEIFETLWGEANPCLFLVKYLK